MNWESWLVWGFTATIVLTAFFAGAQGLGLTRMSIPYLLGTMVTPDRSRAKLAGVFVHLVNGWLFALLYIAIFNQWGGPSVVKGMIIGAAHTAFLLTAGMAMLPSLHPRMASEQHGPDAARQLEPPGFLALHYGVRTPLTVLIGHLVYGAMLGAFYTPAF